MATKAQVRARLRQLLTRLEGNEEAVSTAVPERTVICCTVPDLDSSWYSVIEDGRASPPRVKHPGEPPDITFIVDSDDLIDLVTGQRRFVTALLEGRVRVKASFTNLLRLRALL